jgi:chemotaxis regulatin CheY-phosphate phosphatase CheZ
MSSSETMQVRIQREIAELTQSISGMMSNFRKLQRPLAESREKVPQATTQLDKITQQTEAVTARMLDVVEQMTQREEEVIRGIDQIRTKSSENAGEEIAELAQGLIVKATDNLNAAYQIMESLQFQDITAQQMDHAASLLEDVENKLHGILATLGAPESIAAETVRHTPRKARAYDPHADFVDHKTNQKDIDSLFAKKGF